MGLELQPFYLMWRFGLEHQFFFSSLPEITITSGPTSSSSRFKEKERKKEEAYSCDNDVPQHQQYPSLLPLCTSSPPFPVSLVWVSCLNLHNEDEVMADIFGSQCLPTCNPSQSPPAFSRLTNRHTMLLCKASAVMPGDNGRLFPLFFSHPST